MDSLDDIHLNRLNQQYRQFLINFIRENGGDDVDDDAGSTAPRTSPPRRPARAVALAEPAQDWM